MLSQTLFAQLVFIELYIDPTRLPPAQLFYWKDQIEYKGLFGISHGKLLNCMPMHAPLFPVNFFSLQGPYVCGYTFTLYI